jgi:hypothetical protein
MKEPLDNQLRGKLEVAKASQIRRLKVLPTRSGLGCDHDAVSFNREQYRPFGVRRIPPLSLWLNGQPTGLKPFTERKGESGGIHRTAYDATKYVKRKHLQTLPVVLRLFNAA